jgi:hypothetical protein
MKKTIIFVCCLLIGFSVAAFGESWHTANSVSVAWDEVTTNDAGDPIDPTEISYKVFLANSVTDPDHANPVEIGTTTDVSYLVTLNVEGKFHVGVSAVRTVGGEVVAESSITWSNDPAYDFGIQYFLPPSSPGGLRPQ